MARKRISLEGRIAKLRDEIDRLVAQPSTTATRRTLAGKRAALHVMERAATLKDTGYCKC